MEKITIRYGNVKISLWPNDIDGKPWTPTDEETDNIFKNVDHVESIESIGAIGYCIILNYPCKEDMATDLASDTSKIRAIINKKHSNKIKNRKKNERNKNRI